MPASSIENHMSEFSEALNTFKVKLIGTETNSKCSKEEVENDFQNLLASIKRDQCSRDLFKIDKNEFQSRACPRVKVNGFIDRYVGGILSYEKDELGTEEYSFRSFNEFLKYYEEAKDIYKKLGSVIHEERIDHSVRAAILAKYIESVLLPMRDVFISMSYNYPKVRNNKNIYLKLLPYLTEEFYKGLSDKDKKIITDGTEETAIPFYLTIIEENNLYKLDFDQAYIIKRDMLTLLKSPTKKNYMMALKWMTTHMMLSQMHVYKKISGENGEIAVPSSCQNHFNGNLPGKVNFSYEDGGTGDDFLNGILTSHGLVYNENDTMFLDYYFENINKDPTKDGYSGVIPFENFKSAIKSQNKNLDDSLYPQFDDVTHFETVVKFKQGEIYSLFKKVVNGQQVTLNGFDILQKVLGTFQYEDIGEIKLKNGETKSIYLGRQNLSPYLFEVMQEYGVSDFSELITPAMKEKFINKRVLIDFPSIYSSPIWRDWGLKTLADAVFRNQYAEKGSGFYRAVQLMCEGFLGKDNQSEIYKACRSDNKIAGLVNALNEFRLSDQFISIRILEKNKWEGVYQRLSFLWHKMRDELDLLPEAKPFELNFLLDQMSSGNPWARLKLGFLVALNQLSELQDGKLGKYQGKMRIGKDANSEGACEFKDVSHQFRLLKESQRILGLHQPLTYNHAGSFLTVREQTEVWTTIYDEIQERNSQIFTASNKGKKYYEIIDEISEKTVLTANDALKLYPQMTNTAKKELDQLSSSVEASLADFFISLYQMKDPIKQQELFEKFSIKNGIDNTYSVKQAFLSMDQAYKKIIYKDLIRQAALARRLQIQSELKKFCELDLDNENDFKNIFYSTTKAQNELNKMSGGAAVSDEVMAELQDKLSSMTKADWRDLWIGLGTGVMGMSALGISSVVMGGACTALSGGLCAPLAGAMILFGLGTVGGQMVLVSNEVDRKKEADVYEKNVKSMEDLGFTKTGSSEEVSRSYGWAAFEAISILPFLQVATRSLELAPKLALVGTRMAMKATGKTAFNARVKSIIMNEDVRAAKYLIGISSIKKNAGLDAKMIGEMKLKISKIKKLYTSGEINLNTMLSKVNGILSPLRRLKQSFARTLKEEYGEIAVKESISEIDSKTSVMISRYFGENPYEMLRFVQDYSGERLHRALRVMNEIESSERIANRFPVFGAAKDWFLRLRNEHLAKNSSKILKLETELREIASNKKSLDNYILKNIDDITDIFIDIPMKKREIPYFIFAQGMPDFSTKSGKAIPILSKMADGQIVRRIITARSRLVLESYKAKARVLFKINKDVKSDTFYRTYKAFQVSIAEVANKKSGQELASFMGSYRRLEESLTRKLYVKFANSGQKMEYNKFKNLINSPKNLNEQAQAEALWESVPVNELLNIKEIDEIASKVAKELSSYKDVDSFERYLGALKLLTADKNPAVLEIM